MKQLLIPAALAALALVGCAAHLPTKSGPGVECDACARDELAPSALAPGGVAQAAAAEGGQRASNQPVQTDPGARGIHSIISRGSAPVTDSSSTSESRSQAGAPSVNQGLILPTTAEIGGGYSPAVTQAAENVKMLRASLQLALASNSPNVADLSRMLSEAQTTLATAEQGARPSIVYNLQGSTSTQTVANGSKSGGGDNADAVTIPKPTAARLVHAAGAPPIEVPEPPPPTPLPPAPTPAVPAPVAPGMQ